MQEWMKMCHVHTLFMVTKLYGKTPLWQWRLVPPFPPPHRFYQFSFVCFLMKEVEFAALDHKCHRQRCSSFWLVSAITRTWERKFYGELLIVWSREQVLLKEVIYLRTPVSFNMSTSLPHTHIYIHTHTVLC